MGFKKKEIKYKIFKFTRKDLYFFNKSFFKNILFKKYNILNINHNINKKILKKDFFFIKRRNKILFLIKIYLLKIILTEKYKYLMKHNVSILKNIYDDKLKILIKTINLNNLSFYKSNKKKYFFF